MTDKEKAIVMAYTGACMLTGDKFQIFHKYVEDIMGRQLWVHELGWLEDKIKEKSKADFMALCESESSSENDVIDKIRSEIKALTSNRGFLSCSVDYIHEKIDAVFDKYKAEKDVEDGNED